VDSIAVREVGDSAVLGEAVELGLAVGGHAHDELEARLAAADPGGVPACVVRDGRIFSFVFLLVESEKKSISRFIK